MSNVNLNTFSGSNNTAVSGNTYFGTLASGATLTIPSGATVYFYNSTSSDNKVDNQGTIVNNGTIYTHQSGINNSSNRLRYFLNKSVIKNNGNIHLKISHTNAIVNGVHCIYNYQNENESDDTPQIINSGNIGTVSSGTWSNDAGIINSSKVVDDFDGTTWSHGNYISNLPSPIYYNNDGTVTVVSSGTSGGTGGCAIMPENATAGSSYQITGDNGTANEACDVFTLQGDFNIKLHPLSLNVSGEITYSQLLGFEISSGITLTCGESNNTNSKLTIGDAHNSFTYVNNGTVEHGASGSDISNYYSFSSNATSISSDDEGTVTCFYGFVNVMTKEGLKQIKDLKRGDLILTNDGYQPLAKLDIGFNPSNKRLNQLLNTTNFMVKIPKDFLAKNVPSEDVYVTDTHPLSVRITSDKNDKDFEFLHLFARELVKLNGNVEYVKLNEKYLYNLMFDKHYEINVGGMKFLSHHPNHNNNTIRLNDGEEINANNRSKKVYVDKNNTIYFKDITLKDLLKEKPESLTDKEYLAQVLVFNA